MNLYICINQKLFIMKAKLSNSIYQQKTAGPGLSVSGGMLINNRPDGVTGIKMMSDMKRAMMRAEKVNVIVEANTISDMRENMFEID